MSDPTSESRKRLTGMKTRGWFLGATFARLIAADIGVTDAVGRQNPLPDDARLAALLDLAERAANLAAAKIAETE